MQFPDRLIPGGTVLSQPALEATLSSDLGATGTSGYSGGPVKIKKHVWIPMEELDPPQDWTLPFYATWQGTEYKITGADYVDRVWRGEKV